MPTEPAQVANLFLPQDLVDSSKTNELGSADLRALQTVASWITTFVARSNKDLGRAGPVCPFVPVGLERGTVWLAPEQIAIQSVPHVIQLLDRYKNLLLHTQPLEGDDADYKAVVVVFTDVSADGAQAYMDDPQVLDFKRLSYAEDGVVIGDFYERNAGTSIYSSSFHPFRAPVPFLLMRRAVISDWKFFLENEEWLRFWARRFGESAIYVLAEELRRTNWRRLEREGG